MPLVLLFISAFMLSGLLLRHLKLDDDAASRGIAFTACVAMLGLFCFGIGIYSISACILYLLALMAATALISQKLKAPEKAKTSSAPSAETFFLLFLCGLPFLFVYAVLLVPVVQNWENSGTLTLLHHYSVIDQFKFDPLTPESAEPQLGYALFAMNFSTFPTGLTSLIFALFCLYFLHAIALNFVERSTALLGTAAFACSPLFLTFATQPSFDSLFCAFALAAFCATLQFLNTNNKVYLLFAGILCGAACGVYYLGYLVIVLCAITVLLRTRNLKSSLLLSATALLLALPWLLRSYYFSGSAPITATFPYVGVNPEWKDGAFAFLQHMIRFPWETTMKPQNFSDWAANPGIFLIAFALPGFALSNTRLRLLALFALLGGGLFFLFTDNIYALTPFIALLFIVATASLERFPIPAKIIMPFIALALILTGLFMQFAMLYPNRDIIFRRITSDEYLAQKIPHYDAFKYLDENHNDGGTVLLLEPRTRHLNIPAIYNPRALNKIANMNAEAQRAWLNENNIRYLLIPDSTLKQNNHLTQKAKDMLSAWLLDPKLCQLNETLEYPTLNGTGMDRVNLYTIEK